MSRAAACHRFFRPSQILLLQLIFLLISLTTLQRANANPLSDLMQEYQNLISESSTVNLTNKSTDSSTENSTDISSTDISSTDISSTDNSSTDISSTDNSSTDNSSTDNSTETEGNTDVYVIKAVVYEIGILTDTDNTTSESTERQERVDISLYDPLYRTDDFF
ncbi:uncharacterized protein [Anoplolepis gracilipes]|uniref:uncharacterized protein n=1 Tax=Anoplolepis gracilipes TaxID=354296 RepID=UPI003BA2F56E